MELVTPDSPTPCDIFPGCCEFVTSVMFRSCLRNKSQEQTGRTSSQQVVDIGTDHQMFGAHFQFTMIWCNSRSGITNGAKSHPLDKKSLITVILMNNVALHLQKLFVMKEVSVNAGPKSHVFLTRSKYLQRLNLMESVGIGTF